LVDINDKWFGKHDLVEEYSVKDVYHIFIGTYRLPNDIYSNVVWSKLVPVKVSLFVWQTINNRIPTKDNLVRRGVIPSN